MKKKSMKSKDGREQRAITRSNGMAKDEKSIPSPASIQAPKSIAPIMEAFHVESDEVVKALVLDTARAIYGQDDFDMHRSISKNELEGVISLIRSIHPKDSLETLFAAQIVVGHILGLRRLSKDFVDDQRLGLNLLRFSSEAMQMLIKKRSGVIQNIIVNYSYNGQGDALMQTVLSNGERQCQSAG